MTLSQVKQKTLYDQDYLQWIEATLQQLRDRNYEKVDWENLLAEIEDMGKRDLRIFEFISPRMSLCR